MPMRDDRMLTSKVVRDASNNYVRDLLSDHGLIRSVFQVEIILSRVKSQESRALPSLCSLHCWQFQVLYDWCQSSSEVKEMECDETLCFPSRRISLFSAFASLKATNSHTDMNHKGVKDTYIINICAISILLAQHVSTPSWMNFGTRTYTIFCSLGFGFDKDLPPTSLVFHCQLSAT